MELRLNNGQYVMGRYQGLESVEGSEALLQRVLMRLQTRRGSFLPMPQYGSRLHLLSSVKPSKRESSAKLFITEALAEEKGLELTGLKLQDLSDGGFLLTMNFTYNGEGIEAQTIV